MAPISERLKRLLITWLNVDEAQIEPTSSLIEDLHADSLDLVEFAMALEDEFNIRIHSSDMQRIDTVQDVQDYLTLRLSSQSKEKRA